MEGQRCPNPRCGAPLAPGPVCPRCGVIYAKAAARAVARPPRVEPAPPPAPPLVPPPAPNHRPTLEPPLVPPPAPNYRPTLEPPLVPPPAPNYRPTLEPPLVPPPAPNHRPTLEPPLVPPPAPNYRPTLEPPLFPPPTPIYRPTLEPSGFGPAAFEAGPAGASSNEETALEQWLRLLAPPAALIGAWLLMHTEAGRAVGRILFSMWLHELGHAVTAWFCGFHAVPLPWFTSVADERSVVIALMLAAALGWLGYRSLRAGRRWPAALAGALLAAQLICTLALGLERARAFVTFGGDAGGMVAGAALVATFFAGAASPLRRNGLRWGFLVIGAVALMDPFEQWVGASGDSDRIPYGMQSLAGLSDPSKLTEVYGWSEPGMVRAFLGVGIASLLLLAAAWVHGLWTAGTLVRLAQRAGLTAPGADAVRPAAAAGARERGSRS